MNESLMAAPQWVTGSRLLKLSEEIQFEFYLPDGTAASDLAVFPRYLELANPGAEFVAGGDLAWLDSLGLTERDSEGYRVRPDNGTVHPERCDHTQGSRATAV